MNRKLLRKNDLFLIGILLLAAAFCSLLPKLSHGGACRVQILQDSELLYEIDLSRVRETVEYQAGSLTVAVSPEGAQVIRADCPDRICMQQGLLSANGDMAVCVPEKVVVKVIGERSDGLDAVVY